MNTIETKKCQQNWQISKVDLFWNKIAMYDTVYYLYDKDECFINLLAGFVGTGINAGDCNIVIASRPHLEKLTEKLRLHGINVPGLIDDERYYPVDAGQMLKTLMNNGMPSERLLAEMIGKIVHKAHTRKRRVRTYREMAPILKMEGNDIASVKLEEFWQNLRSKEVLSLFCAYPCNNMQTDECSFLKKNGISSSKVIKESKSATEVLYKEC